MILILKFETPKIKIGAIKNKFKIKDGGDLYVFFTTNLNNERVAYLVIDETTTKSIYRAISVLVAASPCAFTISTQSAVLSGIARAAKGGVLIKGGRALEDLGNLTTIAFDKTGTLTEGKPKLTNAFPLNGFERTENEIINGALVVLNHKNLDLIKNRIIESNGKISKDIFSFPGGRRFHFIDPAGNELAVWSDK